MTKTRWLTAASVLLCAGVAVLGFPGCDDNDDNNEQAGTGIIGGNVVSFHAAHPTARLAGALQGVEVTITGPVTLTVMTDANGVFAFPNLPAGEYTMSFKYDGMETSYSVDGVTKVLVLGEGQKILLVNLEIEDGLVTVEHVLVCNAGEECEPPAEPGMLPAPKQLSPPDGSIIGGAVFFRKNLPAKTAQEEEEELPLGTTVAETTRVTLDWKAVPGAAAYVVEIQRDMAATIKEVVEVDPVYVRCEKELLTDDEFTVSLGDGSYRWRVWAVDENANFGRKSGWWSFMVGRDEA